MIQTKMFVFFQVFLFCIGSASKTVDQNHFCHRVNCGSVSRLHLQAIILDPKNQHRLLIVESGQLYESTGITSNSVSLPELIQVDDWLEHLWPNPTYILKHLGDLKRNRVRLLHSIYWGTNTSTAEYATVLHDAHLEMGYLVYKLTSTSDLVYTNKLVSQSVHRVIASQYLFSSNTNYLNLARVLVSNLSTIAPSCAAYVNAFKNSKLFPSVKDLCWFETPDREHSREIQAKCHDSISKAELLKSVPFGFKLVNNKLFLFDQVERLVHVLVIPQSGDLFQVKNKTTSSFKNFFRCSTVQVVTTERVASQKPISGYFVLVITILIAIVCITVIGTLLGMAIMLWLKMKNIIKTPKSKPAKQALSPTLSPTMSSSKNTKSTTDKTGILQGDLKGQFHFTLQKPVADKKKKAKNRKDSKKRKHGKGRKPSKKLQHSARPDSITTSTASPLPSSPTKSPMVAVSSVTDHYSKVSQLPTVVSSAISSIPRTPSDFPEEISQELPVQSVTTKGPKPLAERYRDMKVQESTGFFVGPGSRMKTKEQK